MSIGKLTTAFVLSLSVFSLAGCKTVGSQLGSAVGQTLGSQLGYGLATQTGTVLGSVLGGEIAELLDPASRQQATEATGEAITSGESQSWSNPSAGTSGEVQVIGEKQETTNVQVEVVKDDVQELPPIELIGRTYVATGEANVRGGPGTDYKAVGNLKPGEAVNVVGKVRGESWYMVSQGDVVIGYVSTTLLALPSTPILPPDIKPKGAVAMQSVPAERTCRTASHQVRLSSGEIVTEEIDACESPTGWQSSTRPGAGPDDGGGKARPT
jgi:uncharacterized protein YgiM (DUF1202 family)